MEPNTIKLVREFTKSGLDGINTRNEVAQNIVVARRKIDEITSRIKRLREEAQDIDKITMEYDEKVIEFQNELDLYAEQLARAEATVLNRLYGLFHSESPTVRGLRYFRDKSQGYRDYYSDESTRLKSKSQQVGEIILEIETEKKQAANGQEILNTFYEEQLLKFEEFQQNLHKRKEVEKITSLKAIAARRALYFVHGITPTMDEAMRTRNLVIKSNTTWQSRLAIVLGLQPDLSSSTIQSGDSTANMWSKMGVLLSGGNLIHSHPHDAATRVTSLQGQESSHFQSSFFEMETEEVEKRIDESISERREMFYNELVVRDPQIAGFYVCLDADLQRNTFDTASHQEIIEFADRLNLPIFIVHNGGVFKSDRRQDQFGQMCLVRVGQVLKPEEVMGEEFILDQNMKESIIQQARGALLSLV